MALVAKSVLQNLSKARGVAIDSYRNLRRRVGPRARSSIREAAAKGFCNVVLVPLPKRTSGCNGRAGAHGGCSPDTSSGPS